MIWGTYKGTLEQKKKMHKKGTGFYSKKEILLGFADQIEEKPQQNLTGFCWPKEINTEITK